jgi:hypothetical protein
VGATRKEREKDFVTSLVTASFFKVHNLEGHNMNPHVYEPPIFVL